MGVEETLRDIMLREPSLSIRTVRDLNWISDHFMDRQSLNVGLIICALMHYKTTKENDLRVLEEIVRENVLRSPGKKGLGVLIANVSSLQRAVAEIDRQVKFLLGESDEETAA